MFKKKLNKLFFRKQKKLSKIHTEVCDKECSICCDNLTEKSVHKLPCGHIFHKKCIFRWMEKNEMNIIYNVKYKNIPMKGTCPICRQVVYSIIYADFNTNICLIN
jgi:hypothetical protein